MKHTTKTHTSRSGSALVVVMGLTLMGMLAAASLAVSTSSQVRQAQLQTSLEQAFYLAEGGAERAASYVAAGNENTTTLRGTLGAGRYETIVDIQSLNGGESQINVFSTGIVGRVSRGITMRGLRRVSWARYALWYDTESTKLWIWGGEKFNGPVYSKPQFHFHSDYISTKGQAHFYDKAWTVASTIEKQTVAVNPIFDLGLRTSVPAQTMASISFPDLLAEADVIYSGPTEIILSNKTMYITNTRMNYTKRAVAIPSDGLVYVKLATSGTATKTGDITLRAPYGLADRLTLVADNDILVADHVRYKTNPQTTPTSTDALGLIAKRSVVVKTTSPNVAPNNLDLYAHIICYTGGFGVENYSTCGNKGTLNVYGGIVNKIRNPVSQSSGSSISGYMKNYVFDTRFAKTPPPNYPTLTDEYEWLEWEG